MKLCQVMRVPADFVDVEQESEESAPDFEDYDDEESGDEDDDTSSQEDIMIDEDEMDFGEDIGPLQ